MEPQNGSNKKIGITIGVIVIAAVAFVTAFSGKKSAVAPAAYQAASDATAVQNTAATTGTNTPTPPERTPPPADTAKKSVYLYKDGTYSATGSYMSPGGEDQLGVSVTLKDDIITSASVTNMANDGRSQRYQDMFISGYKQYVIGKNIADVSLSKVSGSSITPGGFNDALAQIKSQAAV